MVSIPHTEARGYYLSSLTGRDLDLAAAFEGERRDYPASLTGRNWYGDRLCSPRRKRGAISLRP